FSSCGSKKAESSIANATFNIVELNGTEYQSLGEKPAFIAFEGEKCNASVGGNSIFASYKEEAEGKLALSEGGMTRMMVPQEYREDEFVEAFNSIASYKAEGDTVTFLNAEGTEVIKAVKVENCCKEGEGCCKEACSDSCKSACCDSAKSACCDSCKSACCDSCKSAAGDCCKEACEGACEKDAQCAEGKECCKDACNK
ncbi:MAG: META domain-containing protein, partial [Candidatus Cryptobacteroides sp.]